MGKKILVLLLALLFAVSLSACSGEDEGDKAIRRIIPDPIPSGPPPVEEEEIIWPEVEGDDDTEASYLFDISEDEGEPTTESEPSNIVEDSTIPD